MLEGEEGEKEGEGEGEGHVGGQERTKHFSPLGTKLHFNVNSSIKNLLFWPPTWPPCHVVANQKYSCMHYSVWIRGCSFWE